MLSSLVDFGIPFARLSGRLSDDCDKLRAFWAEPRIPSRLKLGARPDLSEFGDFIEVAPLAPAPIWGEGISTEKSRFGSGNCLTAAGPADDVMVAVTECGESPLDDGMVNDTANCVRCADSLESC